jgi:hypothetical protein
VKAGLPTMMRMRARAITSVGCLLAAALLAAAPAVAKLKAPGGAHVVKAGVSSLKVAWKDRSKGERRYELRVILADDSVKTKRLKANARKGKITGLDRGEHYIFEVGACGKGSRCGPLATGQAATLLAPFNGPHPSPNCETFPASDDFNDKVTTLSTHPRSDQIISSLPGDLHPDFGSNPEYGIPYVVVPPFQPPAKIRFTAYGDESDPGPYPIPPGAPIEGGRNSDGDRHVLVVERPSGQNGACKLYELYRSFEKGGPKNLWTGDSGAVFDLGSPLLGQRPDGWTSADAAGLPIYPGLVTLEEVRSGVIDHAIRITFSETRRAYIPPATHYASDSCNQNLPAMGERFRLRPGYDISGITGDARVIATALKQYGAIVADNGSNYFISGSTDPRWNDENLNQLKEIPASAFEVVAPQRQLVSGC